MFLNSLIVLAVELSHAMEREISATCSKKRAEKLELVEFFLLVGWQLSASSPPDLIAVATDLFDKASFCAKSLLVSFSIARAAGALNRETFCFPAG